MRFIVYIHVISVATLAAQPNLVPNSGFENVGNCSVVVNVLNCPPWIKATDGTPDNFHTCFSNTCCTVPINDFGIQSPYSGNGYAGIVVFGGDYREYLEVKLYDSLIQGKEYCVKIYVSLAEGYSGRGIDGIGAYFSPDSIYEFTSGILPYTPQIGNVAGNCISDSTGWVLIADAFIASGEEKFITIGNFKPDSSTDTSCFYTSWPIGAYLFLDEISVTDCGWSGISGNAGMQEVQVFPNPAGDFIEISYSAHERAEFVLYDVSGKEILRHWLVNGNDRKLRLDVSPLSAGAYFWIAGSTVHPFRQGKLMIVK